MRPSIRRLVLVAMCSAMPFAITTPVVAKPAPPAPPAPPDAPDPAIAPEPPTPPQPPAFVFASATDSSGRGRLGLQVSSMTPELRMFFGAKPDTGILVQRVESGSPSALGGLKVGDVIVSVDGDTIEEIGEVAEALSDRSKGDKVEIVVVRKKSRRTLKVALQEDSSDRRLSPRAFHFGG
jgi:membrane-associated protease RseP (regulator of RpoE activity)